MTLEDAAAKEADRSSAPQRSSAPAPLGLSPSFGFGDRLGLATPGHLAALREAGGSIRGVFAQQSIREMARTGRTPQAVMEAAATALAAADFGDAWSADGDHLKSEQDIQRVAAAGFVLYTLDPSEYVDELADQYDARQLGERLAAMRDSCRWLESYRGRSVRLDSGTIDFDEQSLARAAVKYGRAIERSIELARIVEREATQRGQRFEIELSVDETAQPTTPAEHYIIAEQLRSADICLTSLAPRFVGDYEKGVDFKGDRQALASSMRLHAEIADRLGPYKLSLHSGSDKISIYPILSRATQGRFHVKTAGTSYLEALRVAARGDETLFRDVIAYSRSRYDEDKATYHVSATLRGTPAPEVVGHVVELERLYLDRWEDTPAGCGFTQPGRQILHCTFGSIYTHPQFGPRLLELLAAHPQEYREVLRQHFVRHLAPLRAG